MYTFIALCVLLGMCFVLTPRQAVTVTYCVILILILHDEVWAYPCVAGS